MTNPEELLRPVTPQDRIVARLAAQDGRLFAFIESVRARLPPAAPETAAAPAAAD